MIMLFGLTKRQSVPGGVKPSTIKNSFQDDNFNNLTLEEYYILWIQPLLTMIMKKYICNLNESNLILDLCSVSSYNLENQVLEADDTKQLLGH